jgi:DNA invertase Pin-like site-specific DNA recombinase
MALLTPWWSLPQREGIARAKVAGAYKGRKPTARAQAERVMELLTQGMTREAAAKEVGIGVTSVYRILQNNRKLGTA